jgi:hypothetical protein
MEPGVRRAGLQHVHNLNPRDDLSEGYVLIVAPWGRARRDEELDDSMQSDPGIGREKDGKRRACDVFEFGPRFPIDKIPGRSCLITKDSSSKIAGGMSV